MAFVLLSSTASFLYRGINTNCSLLAWKSASVRVSGRAALVINNAGNPSRSGIDVVRNKIKMFAQQKVPLSSPSLSLFLSRNVLFLIELGDESEAICCANILILWTERTHLAGDPAAWEA